MFVSVKYRKPAAALALSMFSVAMLVQYKAVSALEDAEERYLNVLQQQTEKFAKRRANEQRLDFLENHKKVFHRFSRYRAVDSMREVVLQQLHTAVDEEDGLDVSYEFLAPQQQHDFGSNNQIVSDSLRLKGAAENMLDFNRAIRQLDDDELHLFELSRCDIRRKSGLNSKLQFDCFLSWYLMLSFRN